VADPGGRLLYRRIAGSRGTAHYEAQQRRQQLPAMSHVPAGYSHLFNLPPLAGPQLLEKPAAQPRVRAADEAKDTR
jgi:hypothetical protein